MTYWVAAVKQMNQYYFLAHAEVQGYFYLTTQSAIAEPFFFVEDAIGSYREFCEARKKGPDTIKGLILFKRKKHHD